MHALAEQSGINPGDIANWEDENVQPRLHLVGEEPNNGKDFPWRQIMGAMKRITPHMKMPTAGPRRDRVMKRFWRVHGRSIAAFEELAKAVAASDFLQGRNGHVGDDGRPFTWGWIFDRNEAGDYRADKVMNGDYSNDRMAWVLEKKAKSEAPKLTKCWDSTYNRAVFLDLKEMHDGQPRYRSYGDVVNGLPVYFDQR